MKNLKTLTSVAVLGLSILASGTAFSKDRETGRNTGPVVFVTSQALYYDSIVLADLPMKGNFQQLIPGENGLQTEFGPGEVGHLGGRWWIDVNGDSLMDSGDKFFLCPLLGPGRTTL